MFNFHSWGRFESKCWGGEKKKRSNPLPGMKLKTVAKREVKGERVLSARRMRPLA